VNLLKLLEQRIGDFRRGRHRLSVGPGPDVAKLPISHLLLVSDWFAEQSEAARSRALRGA
jgi:hypothetical protein